MDDVISTTVLNLSGGRSVGNLYGAGMSTQKTWMDDIKCAGNEFALYMCIFNGWGIENCGHGEDVGVVCDTPLISAVCSGKVSCGCVATAAEVFSSRAPLHIIIIIIIRLNGLNILD